MVTTTAPLIDIAVEAGYGSHEAFTRAFTRSYGVAPAAWRRRPGHIQLAAPSGVHFHPPGSLRLPSRKRGDRDEPAHEDGGAPRLADREMIRVAGRLSDDQLDQPIELDVDEDDEQTIRSLLSRLVGQMGMWNAALATRDHDWSVEEHEPLDAMRSRLAVEGPAYLAHVHDVVDHGRLDETFVDALCEPAEVFTHGGMIAHVLTFAAHRRTLVALALAQHGADGSAGATRCSGWPRPPEVSDPARPVETPKWLRKRRALQPFRSLDDPGPPRSGNGPEHRPGQCPGGDRLFLVLLAVGVLTGVVVADRLGVPAPLLLVVAGVAASFLPFVLQVHLEPEVVLLGLLPPLLYSGPRSARRWWTSTPTGG